MKPLRVYWVSNAVRSGGEWVPTLGAARRLACTLYADAATKAPGRIDRYTIPDCRRLTRAIAVALLRGDGFASGVESVNPQPWRKS